MTDQPVKKKFWTIRGVLAMGLVILLVMAFSIPGGGPGRMAFRTSASNYASQVVAACQGYQTEYGAPPETSENYRLKKILCGDNSRKIEFLSLKPKDFSANGEMIDPWGTPFRITFDSGNKVLVVSAGPDKIFGTADDITNQ